MDFIITTIRNGIPIFILTILGAFLIKGYWVSRVKSFDLAEVF
jgi:hypothetical protein